MYIYIIYIIYISSNLNKKLKKIHERFWLQGAKSQSQSPSNSASKDRILRLNFCSLTKIFFKCLGSYQTKVIWSWSTRAPEKWENSKFGSFFLMIFGPLTPMITLNLGYLDLFCSPRVV